MESSSETLVTSYGFIVHDIGIDVPPREFVQKALELKPDIIGLSGLLTSSFASMKDTIRLFRQQTDLTIAEIPIVIAG